MYLNNELIETISFTTIVTSDTAIDGNSEFLINEEEMPQLPDNFATFEK